MDFELKDSNYVSISLYYFKQLSRVCTASV